MCCQHPTEAALTLGSLCPVQHRMAAANMGSAGKAGPWVTMDGADLNRAAVVADQLRMN